MNWFSCGRVFRLLPSKHPADLLNGCVGFREDVLMRRTPSKSEAAPVPSKPARAQLPDIFPSLVRDTLEVLHVNRETGLPYAEVDVRIATIPAFSDVGFAMVVTAIIGALPGFFSVGQQ